MKKLLTLMLSLSFILFTSGCSCNNDVNDNEIYETNHINVPMIKAYKQKNIDGEYTYVYPFNTSISLNYFKGEDITYVENYFKEEFSRLHMLFDRHYYYYDDEGKLINNLRVINESGGKPVVVEEDLISILKEAIRFTKLSKGKFNIGVGNLSGLWDGFISYGSLGGVVNLEDTTRYEYKDGEYIESEEGNYIYGYGIYVDISDYNKCIYNAETRECVEDINGTFIEIDESAPSVEQVNDGKSCVPNYDIIENIISIDDENNTVKINDLDGCNSGVSITLGALAKSYAAEKIINEERFKNGNYLLNVGQSTIKLIGRNLSRESREWQIGITDSYLVYRDGGFNKYATYLLKSKGDISLSTSSGDENHYYYKDKYYHHIIDPVSGYPNQNRFAVTATCENAMYADIITTALMSMNMEETRVFLGNLSNQDIDVEVVIQDKVDGGVKVYATNTLKNKLSIRFNNESLEEYLNSIVIEELSYES